MIEEYFVCIYKLTTSITSIHPLPNLVERFPGYVASTFIARYHCLRLSTAYWCERPELFAAIADAKDGEDRVLAVLNWFIANSPFYDSTN